MKILLSISLSLIIYSCSFAQNRNIYFFRNDGAEVRQQDSADFTRIIQEPDSGSTYFKVFEFYPDNSKKFVGQVSSFEPKLIYEGATMLYHKNGKKATQVSYLFGIRVGLAYYFYSNGRVKKEVDFSPEVTDLVNSHDKLEKSKLLAYFDSAGTQTVKDGSGFAILTDEEDMLREEGGYLHGLKDGIWKGLYNDSGHYYEEHYKNGVLTSGIQTTADNQKLNYLKIEEPPQYSKTGDKSFHSFLIKNIDFSNNTRGLGTMQKISLHFTVKADGNISNIKATTSSVAMDQEIVNILKRSGKWIPGKFRGEPIDAKHAINLGFNRTLNIIETQQIPRGSQPSRTRRNF